MTHVAGWQPARLPDPRLGDPAGSERQLVSFTGYALDPAWLRADAATRRDGARELAAVIEVCRERVVVDSFTTLGVGAETDLLLRRVARDLGDLEAMAAAMRRTGMGRCLRAAHSCLAMTGPPLTARAAGRDAVIGGGGGGHLLLCPLVRTAAWDALPDEERRDITRELLRYGREAPDCDATYSVGLGTCDAVLTFETDRPENFAPLLEGLRRTRSAQYARRDAPVSIGTRQDPAALLARIGGV